MSKKKPAKRRVGRPTKYDPKYCEMLIDHMSQGLSLESFAGELSISKATLYTWLDQHDEFLDARAIGVEKCRAFWERLGVKLAQGEIQGNSKVWDTNMKNRFKQEWRDRHEYVVENRKPSIIERSNGDQIILDVTPVKEIGDGNDDSSNS